MLITRIRFVNFLPETLCLKCALAREWCPSATLEGRAEASVTFNLIVPAKRRTLIWGTKSERGL